MPLRHPDRWLAPWVEGQLEARRSARVADHVRRCARCRRQVEDVRRGLAAVRDLESPPVPAALERRLEELLRGVVPRAPGAPPRRAHPAARRWAWAAAAAAAIGLASWTASRRGVEVEPARTPAGPLESLALASRERLVRGELELDVASDSPAAVRAWLARRGLSAALATHRRAGETGGYRLLGAADVSRPGLSAAAIAYRIDAEPLVLLTARAAQVPEAPRWGLLGKRVIHRARGGTHLLTWTNSGKAYTLAGGPRVERGCLLCHTDAARRAIVRSGSLAGGV